MVAAGLGGCTLSDVSVAVAGYDTGGTLVVGATDCSAGGGEPDEITVYHDSEIAGRIALWSISPYGGSSNLGVTADVAPPPEPVPARLDEVPLISVGDPTPLDWDTERVLDQPIPEGGRLQVVVDFGYGGSSSDDEVVLDLPPGGGADRYVADIEGRPIGETDGATLGTDIQETCDEATAFDGGRFTAILGASTAVVLVLGVLLGVIATRQYRRAGRAATDRRAGPPSRPG